MALTEPLVALLVAAVAAGFAAIGGFEPLSSKFLFAAYVQQSIRSW